MLDTDKLFEFISQVDKITKKPEKLLTVQDEQATQIKNLTRDIYNFNKKNESKKLKSKESLESLVIENLDDEQIWQQIDLQNNSICNSLVSSIAHLLAQAARLKFPLKNKRKKSKEKDENGKKDEEEEEEEEEEEDEEEKEDEGEEDEEERNIKPQKKVKSKHVKSSILDDKFFKLHEMEEFLEAAENDEEEEDDNEIIDYFEDDDGDEDEEAKNQMRYNDFFDEPGDEDVSSNRKRKDSELSTGNENKKKVKFSLEEEEEEDYDDFSGLDDFDINKEGNDEDEDEDEDDDDDDDDENGDKAHKQRQQPSSFEARQERLKSKINALEEEALKEKPWQLKGEVTATNRPQNSLLEEYVEFDIATRPAPILTEKSTLKLEDIIIQRIKDKAWDDVVRKVKPIESEIEYKKKLVLDHEKSKLSLAQIYEKEYLKQLDDQNQDMTEKPEVEIPEHQVIRNMMKTLFVKLDALSNFHFTPKQAEPEVKIINNLPAITMEEVAPVATSDAALLAPEEVKAKSKGDVKGKSERTATDKKRERRKKKILQKLKFQRLEAKAKAQLEKQQNIKDKLPEKVLQKITKSRNVTKLKESEGGKYLKSSNAFFSKLQDKTRSKLQKKDFGSKSVNLGKKVKKGGNVR